MLAVLAGCSPSMMPKWSNPKPFQPPPVAVLERAAGVSAASLTDPSLPGPGDPKDPGFAGLRRDTWPTALDLSVVEAVRLAFENNRNLRVRRLNPAIAAQDVDAERAAFDPVLSAAFSINQAKRQIPENNDSDTRQVVGGIVVESGDGEERPREWRRKRSTLDYRVESGLSWLSPVGTQIALTGSWQLSDSSTTVPNHITNASLRAVQPVLRGFGAEFQLSGIELAARNTEVAHEQFLQAAMDTAAGVERAYWDLVLTQLNFAVQGELLDSNRRRLAKNRDRIRLGARNVDALTIRQDEAALASREENLLRIANQVEVARLQLLRLLSPHAGADFWAVPIKAYLPKLDVDAIPPLPAADASIKTALAERPEMRAAQLGVEVNAIRLRQARHNLMPQLDLIAAYGPVGQGPKVEKGFEAGWKFRGYAFETGAQFSWAMGNRLAAAGFDRAELQKIQAERLVEDTAQSVALDVRLALQNLDNAARRYKAALVAQTAQAETLALAERAEGLGKPGTDEFFLIQFEDNLTNSRFSVNQALTDWLRALTDLRRAEGTILKVRGLDPGR